MRTYLLIVLLTVCSVASAAAQENSWVGKSVLAKKEGLKLGVAGQDGKTNYVATLGLAEYQVLAEERVWIRLREGGAEGWLEKNQTVLLDEAGPYFGERIRSNPGDVYAYYARAFIRLKQNDVDGAIKDYGEVIRLQPSDHVFCERGLLWKRKGDYDQALSDLNAAVTMCEQLAGNLTNARMMTPDLSSLPKRDARVIRFFKMDQMMGMMLSEVVNEVGRVAFAPKMGQYLAQRGDCWLHKGNYDRALADENDALRHDSTLILAYRTRGLAWQAKRDLNRARSDFEMVRSLDPNDWVSIASLAWILATAPDAGMRDGRRALELAREAQKIRPQNAACLDVLAAAHAETGDFASALRCQEQALADPQIAARADSRRRLELYKKGQPYRQE